MLQPVSCNRRVASVMFPVGFSSLEQQPLQWIKRRMNVVDMKQIANNVRVLTTCTELNPCICVLC